MTRLRSAILRWYDRHRRDLPWRRTRDPYAIWVSEVMLQQTGVETAQHYYGRFLTRFPTTAALARAPRSEVLALWSGLGYYRRAENLHRAAVRLIEERGGRVPDDPGSLQALPGIGAYTAAAIASVAFDRPAVAVDGNVIRVLSRIAGIEGARHSGRLRREVAQFAAALAAGPRPGDWTQAIMELGALVCRPRAPRCRGCPARDACAARRTEDPERFPEPKPARRVPRERRVLLVVRHRARFLLVRDGRGARPAWCLPSIAVAGRRAKAAAESLAGSLGLARGVRGPLLRFAHRTYAEDLRFEVWEASIRPPRRRAGGATAPRVARGRGMDPGSEARWIRGGDLESIPTRAPTLKAIRRLP